MTAEQSWRALRAEAKSCTRCDLYKYATQTVFGEGALEARILFVGEQPGDQEDLAGRPFVGPAGQIFDRALADAGVERERTYVTNAVKHFKFVRRGKRRIHDKPDGGEIAACRWWLQQELALVRPPLIVALGATAAHALFGKVVTISALRGRGHPCPTAARPGSPSIRASCSASATIARRNMRSSSTTSDGSRSGRMGSDPRVRTQLEWAALRFAQRVADSSQGSHPGEGRDPGTRNWAISDKVRALFGIASVHGSRPSGPIKVLL